MKHYQYTLANSDRLEEVQFLLAEEGLENIYTLEQDASLLVGGFSNNEIPAPEGATLFLTEDADINWEEQWKTFSPFAEADGNEVSCSLKAFGGPDRMLSLVPGPGFGDLSHPTTQLMLQLLCVEKNLTSVVDVGCGSGVLSVAALLLGASHIYAFDIDEEASIHTQNNLERHESSCEYFCDTAPPSLIADSLVLCNMTFGEMKIALKSLNTSSCRFFFSGIRVEQREEFLLFLQERGLTAVKEDTLDQWMSFIAE